MAMKANNAPPPPPGAAHGPGNVTRLPEMFRAAAEYSGLSGQQPVKTGAMTSGPFNVDAVRFLIVGILSNIPQVQRYIIDHYAMPDIEFVHALGSTRGRENYFHVMRSATFNLDYHVVFRDIILTPHKACVWTDLKVKPRHLPFMGRHTFPCLIVFHFATDPADGRTKVSFQQDHFSLTLLNWWGGLWSQQISEAFVRPLLGQVLILSGKNSDFLDGCVKRVRHMFGYEDRNDVISKIEGTSGSSNISTVSNGFMTGGPQVDERSKALQEQLLQACIQQATAEVGTNLIQHEETSFWDAFGILGLVPKVTLGTMGLIFGWFMMFLIMIININPFP